MREDFPRMIEWATEQATSLLAPLGKRWLHVQGVAERAHQVGKIFPEEAYAYLLAAAYLHDIGYAPSLKKTGFHPLDGAVYLRAFGKERLACLVAHHSEAQYEGELRGYASELNTFPREKSAVADALTYCDMTTGPAGMHISMQERIADIFQRYGETDTITQAIRQALPSLSGAVRRTQERLSEAKLLCPYKSKQ